MAASASRTGRGAEASRAISGRARPIAASFAGSVFSSGASDSRASAAGPSLSSGMPVFLDSSARAACFTALLRSTGVAEGQSVPKSRPYGPATHWVNPRAASSLSVGSMARLVASDVTDASGEDHTTLMLDVSEGGPASFASMPSAVVDDAPGRANVSLNDPANREAPSPMTSRSSAHAISARTG